LIKTDVQLQLPEGYVGSIAPGSRLAVQHNTDVGAGVINEDYRDKLAVILFNDSEKPHVISCGKRIAQLICQKIYYPELEKVNKLDDTRCCTGGFGSTGRN
jgi:dUTP pyrophosphatase